MFETLQVSHQSSGVSTVTLNRPAVGNAFNQTMVLEIARAFADLNARPQTRVAVLRGTGKHFSAGADVEWMRTQATASPEQNRQGAREMAAMFAAVHGCRVPVVALVQGAALGGGTGLACAVDIALAAEGAFFGFTEVRLGIVPAVISPYAVRRLGYSQSRAWFLLGSRIPAAEALRIGLVHFVSAEPEQRLRELCADLLAGGPAALERCKQLHSRVWLESDPTDFVTEQISAARAGAEGREGLEAFLARRAPSWQAPD